MNVPEGHVTVIKRRVYYSDTDAGAVAHHATHVRWFEQARTEWVYERGQNLEQWQNLGFIFVVARLNLAYLRPIRLGDEITISARLERYHQTGSTFEQEIHVGETKACAATVRLACVSLETGRAVRVPDEMRIE